MLPCSDQFPVLDFAQLTFRESLRDIEACLSAQSAKLYHMGIRTSVKRSTLADANERRHWRIYAEFAQRLITQARELYAQKDLGLDLSNTVYALDSTIIDLCLSMFPWAPFCSTKAAVGFSTRLVTIVGLRTRPTVFAFCDIEARTSDSLRLCRSPLAPWAVTGLRSLTCGVAWHK